MPPNVLNKLFDKSLLLGGPGGQARHEMKRSDPGTVRDAQSGRIGSAECEAAVSELRLSSSNSTRQRMRRHGGSTASEVERVSTPIAMSARR